MMTRRDRRAATARMTKCGCGNVCREGDIYCGQCADRNERQMQAEREVAETERRAALVELASFDTTRFPGMEAEAVRQAERFGVNPIDLLLACESIFRAGLDEVRAANGAENG